MSLKQLIDNIKPLDEIAMRSARARQDMLTKPAGSLGRLESLSIQIAGITANASPHLEHKVIVVMAGDHGVTAEGVSAYPSEVTPQMVMNFINGGAAINVLARHVGARVTIVDMGLAIPLPAMPGFVNRRVALGTGNITKGPAMTRAQAMESILSGAEIVTAEIAQGLDILGTGDMGIGNTTPSAAIACALTGFAPAEIVGRGTGVDDAGLYKKISAVERALKMNQPDARDALDVLAKVGGFEIGGLAGAMIAAAANRKPVMVDGFISTAAAMLAVSLAPGCWDYLIAAHHSQERGHQAMLDWLKLAPLINLDLRLGEGSGAALGISLADAACKILNEMATFGEAGVSEKG
ncbi:MAG: nicotinate-nucleotide--dimethylbenzimidazole phosphoribosyltransferase [Anaerolineales bacterium]|nr:nicotinate-nucleotide--dimethylbenzimidazole phosphoribosyltransferase [Anaerolineales bacterium]